MTKTELKTHAEHLNTVNKERIKGIWQLKREKEELHRSNSKTKEEEKMEVNDMTTPLEVGREGKGRGMKDSKQIILQQKGERRVIKKEVIKALQINERLVREVVERK